MYFSPLPPLPVLTDPGSPGSSLECRFPFFLAARAFDRRNRAKSRGDRAESEEEAKAGMDGWSCPPWTMARPLWPRKEEVTSRAPATETDTHSACSSSSAGRPATGNVRRSALPQTKATGRNTFAPDGKTCPPSGNPTRLFVSFLPRCCYYRSAPCNLNLKKKKNRK